MSNTADKLSQALEGALSLLEAADYTAAATREENTEHGTLLRQCLDMCEQQALLAPEPVRTVHHFACTGGTLICRCIAAMPNVQLLSEVDPLSPKPTDTARPRFAPTDMVTLMRQSTRGTSQALLMSLFHNELRVVHAEAVRLGQRLVIRDHAHSHFCTGATVPERPTFRDLVRMSLPVCSVVTVRHPLDSYASLSARAWLDFSPPSLDEYCRRYLEFLRLYDGIPIVRYEDFVAGPARAMESICKTLKLPYSPDFEDLFTVFRLTGDSGRAGDTIESRPARPAAAGLQQEAIDSPHYLKLAGELNYPARATVGTA